MRAFVPAWFLLAALLGVSPLFTNCTRDSSRVEVGQALMREGNFDGAFEFFQRAATEDPDDPVLKAHMGVLLSLRSISVPAALQLLEDSLRETKNARVRWQLLKLYLDLGRDDSAREILSAENVPLEEFFSPEMSLYRAGVECIADPGRRRLGVLEKKAETPVGRYFLVRCYLATGWSDRERPARLKAAVELLTEMEQAGNTESTENACELLAAWPAEQRPALDNHGERLRTCRDRFPGSIPIQRELAEAAVPSEPTEPVAVADDGQPRVGRGLRKIFSDSYELPPYPDIPHWKSVTGGINLETGKEYIHIPDREFDPSSGTIDPEEEEDPDTRDYAEYFRDARPY